MSKLVWAGLIAAAVFANPAMAAWYDKTAQPSIPPASFTASELQTKASLPEVRGISLPANRQPGARTRAAWRDKNGAAVHPSRVVHCIRAPDEGQFAGGAWNKPPCEPATWRSGAR